MCFCAPTTDALKAIVGVPALDARRTVFIDSLEAAQRSALAVVKPEDKHQARERARSPRSRTARLGDRTPLLGQVSVERYTARRDYRLLVVTWALGKQRGAVSWRMSLATSQRTRSRELVERVNAGPYFSDALVASSGS